MRAIITFHSVDDANEILSFSPALFEYLLGSLRDKQIPVLSLEKIYSSQVSSGVAITFDDGMRSVWEKALPIMQTYGATGTVYLSSELIGSTGLWPRESGVGQYEMMTWEHALALHDAGISLEAHTATHPDLRTLSQDQLEEECETSDQLICNYTGRQPEHFAYPFGYHNQRVRDYIASRYQSAVTTQLAYLGAGIQPAALPRIDSYYLQSRLAIDQLDSLAMRLWLGCRSAARTVAGSQCVVR